MPRHSLLSRRLMTKENVLSSGARNRSSHRVMYWLQDGGSHRMNLVIEGVMQAKTSSASVI
jgi:hypothetical protein